MEGEGDLVNPGIAISCKQQSSSSSSTVTVSVSKEIRAAFRDFCDIDDRLRDARKIAKGQRERLKERKGIITNWMVKMNIPSIKRQGPGGANCFKVVEKDVQLRPTEEQKTEKLADLLSRGISDPIAIMAELKACAGMRKEYRLYRRRPRKTQKNKGKKDDKSQEEDDITEMTIESAMCDDGGEMPARKRTKRKDQRQVSFAEENA